MLLLLTPLDCRARGAVAEGAAAFDARIRWAFGVLSVSYRGGEGAFLRLFGVKIKRLRRADPEAKRERLAEALAAAKRSRRKARRGPLWALRHRRVLWRTLLKALRTLHLRGQLRGVLGLSDPAHTAGAAVILDQLAAHLPDGVVDVDIDWSDEVIDLRTRLSGWVVPLHALLVVVGLFIHPKTRRALRAS